LKNNNFFYQEEKKELISINITPLIDIVFLLLVFFMLATSFIQKSTMEVNLSSGTSQSIEKKNVITIILKKDGNISLNTKLIDLLNIKKEITKKLEQNSNYIFLIKCHKKVEVQKIIRLIEEIRLAGTNKIQLRNF
jgi:biopolymer transport protein ExbD|tara:strand:+ start:724 stop:1131 length:408 start_codon:yes stop_codon:yes gene_type:complete